MSVHVNENSLATILFLKYVNDILGVRVTMDKSIEKAENVILSDGTVFNFKECGLGLYYYDMISTDEQNSAETNTTIPPSSLLSTVTENKNFIRALIFQEQTEREYTKDFWVGKQQVISRLRLTATFYSAVT